MNTPVLDDHELERRLRDTFAAVMPLLVDDESAGVATALGGRHRFERRGRRGVLAAACAVLVVSGVVGVIAVTGDAGRITSGTPSTMPTTTLPTTTTQVPTIGDPVTPLSVPWPESNAPEPPWDPIRIAPGTVGWYDIDTSALPAVLVLGLGAKQPSWTPEYASQFYRCVSWTTDADGPTCAQLAGGSMVEVAGYEPLGVGTLLAPDAPADVAWALADGSLWGYGAFITPPEPDEVQLEGATGYQYRKGQDSYLVWQEAPGQTVWLKGHGLDDDTLIALARTVEPVTLPETLPVLLSLEPERTSTDGAPFGDSDPSLRLAWLDGRPCAGFTLWDVCTPLDEGPTLIAEQGVSGGGPAVAAVVPAGHGAGLVVTLYEIGIQQIERTFTGGGFDVFAFHPGTERLMSAGLVVTGAGGLDPEVTQEVEIGVEAMLHGFPNNVIAEGRTTGTAWVVVRLDPTVEPAGSGSATTLANGTGQYCWVLVEADGQSAQLCPPADPPAVDVGAQADYRSDLDLFEISHNVRSVSCADVDMPIVTDDQLDGRRFAVVSCPNPQFQST